MALIEIEHKSCFESNTIEKNIHVFESDYQPAALGRTQDLELSIGFSPFTDLLSGK